ncbi:GNAT family N-acetyltransferase [Spirilliplanes yamanashiensis]|uniref:GNAT family acetyltransferase n=1 Tax=Spirilliplanes yamanashiensis TaxID=42233 RepID=A0A8J3Y5D2_9ACTN|nr:GNAT family N-acetyltransferase [Spirilliplanes yamanashiensis]MDP9814480.1 putative N-acetyltransferase YhbS [Spirilliplanes yamanashiensis]GIJ02131.1 GNAT family acetyltransferase [Spirilliplanes yamanashiensis]
MDDEFSIAELTDGDLPAVVTLCRSALDLADDAAEAAEIVGRLRERTGTEGWAPGPRRLTGFVAVQRGRVVGVVLGSISHRSDEVGHVDLLAVDPDHRRRGIGRALVGRVEGALSGLGAGEILFAGNAPYYAWPGIDVRYTPAVCAATAMGYENDQTAWNMTADLTYDASPALRPTAEAEMRLADGGISVRAAVAADAPALAAFTLAHFGEGWTGEVTHSLGRDRAGCHLAADAQGAILGFAAYGSSRPSWFGPMGTSPAARGSGIGGVLLRRCLADQRANGVTRAQIGWVGPVPFYSQAAGARIERVFFLYRKQL